MARERISEDLLTEINEMVQEQNQSRLSCLPNLPNGIVVAFISSGWNFFIPFHRGPINEITIDIRYS